MWPLIKSEIDYHRRIFLAFFGFIPLLWIYATSPFIEDMPQGMLIFIMIFLMLQYWIIFRNKEKRDRRFVICDAAGFPAPDSVRANSDNYGCRVRLYHNIPASYRFF
jgi:hypothetical protein